MDTKNEYKNFLYYSSISAVQKCIRRGLNDLAFAMYKIGFETNPYALQRRLFVTLFEDIGIGDLDKVREALYEIGFINDAGKSTFKVASYKDFEAYRKFVDCLCSAKAKSRDGCLALMYHTYSLKKHIDDITDLDRCMQLAIRMYEDNKQGQIQMFMGFLPEIPECNSVFVDFTTYIFGAVQDLAYPFLVLLAFNPKPRIIVDQNEKVNKYVMIGQFPSFTFDMHTQTGKFALAIIAKRYGLDKEMLSYFLFYNEGDVVNQLPIYVVDYKLMIMEDYRSKFNEETYLRALRKDINSARSYAYKTFMDKQNLILGDVRNGTEI